MIKKITLLFFFTPLLVAGNITGLSAQMKSAPTKKPYLSTGMDGFILSTAYQNAEIISSSSKIGTPRFSGFFHIGLNVNYDFTPKLGVYTGLGIKNIGFIEKDQDYTIKRRAYTIGVPVGIKIGNVKHGTYFIAGGGVDLPFNYKEKRFIKRNDKEKFNEWFSSRTPAVMPYVFIGAHMRPLLTFKLQYYPGNFLNPDFNAGPVTGGVGGSVGWLTQPYKGYDVKLIMLTVGFDIPYYPKR